VLRRDREAISRPAIADLPDERSRELPSEAHGSQRGELKREQPLGLRSIEALESRPADPRLASYPGERWSSLASTLTEVLDALCAPTVPSAARGPGLLERLREHQLFTIPLDAQGEWYRYHHLLQDLLNRQLKESESVAEDRIRAVKDELGTSLASKEEQINKELDTLARNLSGIQLEFGQHSRATERMSIVLDGLANVLKTDPPPVPSPQDQATTGTGGIEPSLVPPEDVSEEILDNALERVFSKDPS